MFKHLKESFFLTELKKTFFFIDLIIFLALSDIKVKYSRTIIGPLWLVLSIGIFVIAFGIIGSKLWGLETEQFMPFFASGYVTWILISNIISDSTTVLNNSSHTIKSINTPFFVFIISSVIKNFIIFFHHLIIFFLICFFLSYKINFNLLQIFPSIFLIFLIGVLFSFVWSIICSRFNDVTQLTTNILQIFFFLTPVFWPAERLSGKYFKLLVDLNPVYQVLNLVRSPLLGKSLEIQNFVFIFAIIFILLITSIFIGNKYKKKIIFYI